MKICFVAQQIYPCLARKYRIDKIGGAEVQQMFIGRGLRDKGYDVSYITLDYGQIDGEVVEDLKIYKSFRTNEGMPGVRYFYPRLYKIWQALKKADADIYYLRCASQLAGVLSIFCSIHKKKFVFAGAHDTDFIPDRLRLISKRDKILYQYGLRHADGIIVQSNTQKKLLWKNFQRNSKVIHNFFPVDSPRYTKADKKHILWVSKMRPWKRPELFVRLAESFPEEIFVMIGGRSNIRDRNLFDKIESLARNADNVRFLGFQPLEITETYFDKCKALVNTSIYEGFPNTFLQAWCRGIPVFSYVDPDNVIAKNNLGAVVSSEQELQQTLKAFLSRPQWDRNEIYHYFKTNHSSNVINQYCFLFEDIFAKDR